MIKDLFEENAPAAPSQKAEEALEAEWRLHENLFKRPGHEVKPENLVKTSYQMFSVYKYYENPMLQVRSKYHCGSDEFLEVRDLVPKIRFFDAPMKPNEVEAQ